jgi:hypothetical protein
MGWGQGIFYNARDEEKVHALAIEGACWVQSIPRMNQDHGTHACWHWMLVLLPRSLAVF